MALGTLIHRGPVREPDLFSELWNAPFFRAGFEASPGGFVPALEAVETETEYRVSAELPGLEDKDFEVVIEDGVLTLKGEKRRHWESDDESEAARGYRRVETSWGRFERRLRFDAPIDEEGVKATFRNGLLTVVVPKPAEARPQVRTIEVQTA